jgi:excisionase family DNA binding protein
MSSDTYSTGEAARLLGVSERRVRQLAAAGDLPSTRDDSGRVRLPQAAVQAARRDRKQTAGRSTRSAERKEAGTAEVVRQTVEALLPVLQAEQQARLALVERTEQALRDELHRERAGRLVAEQRAAELTERVAQLEQQLTAAKPTSRGSDDRQKLGTAGEVAAGKRFRFRR